MFIAEILQSKRRWPRVTVPNPKVASIVGFQNYKKPFNVFINERDLLHYCEAFDDVSMFKRAENQPYEYLYNPHTGRIARQVIGQGGWTTIETSLEKNGVDGRATAVGKKLPVGKPRDPAHAWAVIIADYNKIKQRKSA